VHQTVSRNGMDADAQWQAQSQGDNSPYHLIVKPQTTRRDQQGEKPIDAMQWICGQKGGRLRRLAQTGFDHSFVCQDSWVVTDCFDRRIMSGWSTMSWRPFSQVGLISSSLLLLIHGPLWVQSCFWQMTLPPSSPQPTTAVSLMSFGVSACLTPRFTH